MTDRICQRLMEAPRKARGSSSHRSKCVLWHRSCHLSQSGSKNLGKERIGPAVNWQRGQPQSLKWIELLHWSVALSAALAIGAGDFGADKESWRGPAFASQMIAPAQPEAELQGVAAR